MKRKQTLLFLLAVLTIFLVGCRSGDDDKVTLNMAWWGSQVRHDATVQVIELFEQENPHISIEFEFYDYEGYYTKLGTLAASDDIWDVFQLDNQFPQYINQIEPLDDYVADGLIDISNTDDTYLATTTYDGQLVGISAGVNSFAIAYNKAIFDQLGIPEPETDWTWEEFEDISTQIVDGLGIYAISRFEDFIPGAILQVAQEEKGLNFYDKESLSQRLGFDDPTLLTDYFAMRKNLVDIGAYPLPGEIDVNIDLAFQAVRDGRAAMVFIASNQLSDLMSGAPEEAEIKLINPPRRRADGEAGLPVRSSQMFSIAENSAHKEEAAKFIDFITNNEEANLILNGERGVPIMSHIRERLAETGEPAIMGTFQYLETVSELDNGAVNVFDSALNPEIQNQYNLLIERVIFEELSPAEAAESIFTFASDLLE